MTASRILYVVGQLRAGGLERQLWYLLKTLDRECYRPAVAVWRFREDDFYVGRLRELGVPIHFPPPGATGLAKLVWIRRLAKQLRPEVIHSYSFHTNFGAWYAARGTRAIAVGSVRSDFGWALRGSGCLLGRLCARWPRLQVFNSAAAAEKARGYNSRFVPERILVVRNGIDLDYFRATPPPNSSPAVVLGIGSLAPVKRWDRLLGAGRRLIGKGFDLVIKIAGDGPLRGDLLNRARCLGIADRVELVGRSDDIPALLATALVLAHPSDSEGCPNVLMEAMACGRAVVASDVGDTRWIVDEGTTGFVVPKTDENVLVERLGRLLSNRRLCVEMGKAGRLKAERLFGLDRLLSETLAVYRAAGSGLY